MWATIGVMVLTFAMGVYIMVVTLSSIFEQMAMYSV
jgi:hypothetical protein